MVCTWFVPVIIQVHCLQVQVQVQGTSCSSDAGTGTSTGTAKSVPRYRYRYRYKYLTPTLLPITQNKSLCLLQIIARHGETTQSRSKLRRISKAKSSLKSCFGHEYVCVYEVGYRIVAFKSWYLYILSNTPETMFGGKTLRNLLDAFTVHGPWHGLGPVSISDKTSYCKISLSLEAARFVFRIVRSPWNLAGTSAAVLPTCLSNFRLSISNIAASRSYDKTSDWILKRSPGGEHTDRTCVHEAS